MHTCTYLSNMEPYDKYYSNKFYDTLFGLRPKKESDTEALELNPLISR